LIFNIYVKAIASRFATQFATGIEIYLASGGLRRRAANPLRANHSYFSRYKRQHGKNQQVACKERSALQDDHDYPVIRCAPYGLRLLIRQKHSG